jgi:hypothetical protein
MRLLYATLLAIVGIAVLIQLQVTGTAISNISTGSQIEWPPVLLVDSHPVTPISGDKGSLTKTY